jgi:hypothetical protein
MANASKKMNALRMLIAAATTISSSVAIYISSTKKIKYFPVKKSRNIYIHEGVIYISTEMALCKNQARSKL